MSELDTSDDTAGQPWFRQAQRMYLDQFDERLVRLRRLNLRLGEDPAGPELEELYRGFHHLTGSGATYGFPEISETARPVCDLLRQLRASGEPYNAAIQEAVSSGIRSLDRLLRELDRRHANGSAHPPPDSL